MAETDNEKRSEARRLRVGLIADAEEVARYAEALRACAALELCAQGGMPQNAALPEVKWFDDTRVLIAQGGIEALVVATSPRAAVKLSDVAVGHGVPVWRPPPLGRDFAEATEVARQLDTVEVVYRIASWWEHVGEAVGGALRAAKDFKPVFSEVRLSAPGPPLQSWRSSQVDAAGGVLATDAYPLLEALTALRGLPESVSGAVGKCRRRPSEAPRETEDVANAIFRYEGVGMAFVRAAWDIPPYDRVTLHHGSAASVRYTESFVAVTDAEGNVLEERPLPGAFLAAELARFAAEIGGDARGEPAEANTDRHLAVSALLEATYLSSRTEQPEIPRRLFEVQKWPEPRG